MPSTDSLSGFWKAADRLYLDVLRSEGWQVRRMPQGHLEAVRGHYGLSATDVSGLVRACQRADADLRRVRRRTAAKNDSGAKKGMAVDRRERVTLALDLFPAADLQAT